MTQSIPINLAGLAVFLEGLNQQVATGDVTLPTLTPMTDTVNGAGILGDVEVPSSGHYSSMQVGIAWKTINKDVFKLVSSQMKGLEIRGAFKEFDNTRGVTVTKAIKIVVRGFGKGVELGTLVQNAASNTSNTIEVTYIKIFIDGTSVFELDKFNYVSRVNGEDDMADIRKALGLA
ncbi:phage major tail tube protein [Paenibacillus provencensis]|uniref:Phage major tail tube protein n=1 Tax=Paenibacillus provencensis TaxID=441151 RepID=A0ABW3PXJ7_9BACL|nr:phage major tail tube protein [Paenibacillus sp. MER 78]MCM3129016.1 phage major tail tube protein [Paenibacillus sp. MER 78]